MRQVLPRSKKKKKDRDQFLLIFIPPVSRSMPDKQWLLNNSLHIQKQLVLRAGKSSRTVDSWTLTVWEKKESSLSSSFYKKEKPKAREYKKLVHSSTRWYRTESHVPNPLPPSPCRPFSLGEAQQSPSLSCLQSSNRRNVPWCVGKLIRANLSSFLRTTMPGGICWRSALQREMFLIIFTHLIWETHGNLITTVIAGSLALSRLILSAWYVFQGTAQASPFS